jgi:hypothetical protein
MATLPCLPERTDPNWRQRTTRFVERFEVFKKVRG